MPRLLLSLSPDVFAWSLDIDLLRSGSGVFCEAWIFRRNDILFLRQNPANHLTDILKVATCSGYVSLMSHWVIDPLFFFSRIHYWSWSLLSVVVYFVVVCLRYCCPLTLNKLNKQKYFLSALTWFTWLIWNWFLLINFSIIWYY